MGRASRRRAASRSHGVLDEARNITQRVGGPEEIIVRGDLTQKEKISLALSELLQEEIPDDSPLEEYRAALSVIVTAWNLSLLDVDRRSEALKDFARVRKGENGTVVREALSHVERLIVKKEALFPDDKRYVVSGTVRFKGDQLRVTAAALTESPRSLVGRFLARFRGRQA